MVAWYTARVADAVRDVGNMNMIQLQAYKVGRQGVGGCDIGPAKNQALLLNYP